MENASKALIIAGAILLSILLISLGLIVYNQAKNTIGSVNLDQQQKQAFNAKFENYQGYNLIGTKVNELFQLVLSSNAAESENNSNALIIVKYTPKGGSEATIINGTGSVESGQVAHVTPGMKYNITFDYKDGVVQTISIEQQ